MPSHIDLDDAEKIKTLIVNPVVEALSKQITDIAAKQVDQETRITTLEGNQKKALAAWGLASLGVSAVLTSSWEWIRSKIHVG